MKKPFSATTLKLIACITMLTDHIAYVFGAPGSLLFAAMRIIGRIAFPVYCFLLTEGIHHTGNEKKYLLRLGILTLLSEPVYDLMCYRRLIYMGGQSVMVTLLLGAVMCLAMKKLPKLWIKIVMVVPFYILAKYTHGDYGVNGILMIAMFMLIREMPLREVFLVPLFGFLCYRMGGWKVRFLWQPLPVQWYAMLALIPILLYNGQKGSDNKWLNRSMNLFYPLHMGIIVIIKVFFL